ncbi:MAG: glycoside hydrolase family 16 protein [Eubacterium sp.]|nr:glycoside hydrolase family 16 protein [Eubacterium sp.]
MKKFTKKVALGLALVVAFTGISYQAKENKDANAAQVGEWELVWSDEFDGNSLKTENWNIEVNGNGGGNNELQYYTNRKENIEVKDGWLKIHALKESYNGKKYTSGRITTQGKRSFKYGKIEAKIKLPRFNGAWPAFWMLGESISGEGWPACGEMDIMEAINSENNVYSNLHWSYNGNQADTNGTAYNVTDRTQAHVYGMEWNEKIVKFYVDNTYFQTYVISDEAQMEEFRRKQFIILNLAIGGNWPGNNIDDTAFPDRSTMEVDYVRVYQKKEAETETRYLSESDIDVVEDANKLFTTYQAGENSGWAGSAVITSQSMTVDGGTVNVSKVGNNIWGLQAHSSELEGLAGNTYSLTTTVQSSIDKKVRIKVRGNDSDSYIFMDKTLNLKANVPQTLSETVVIPSDFEGFLKLDYGYGNYGEEGENLPENTPFTISISNTKMETHKVYYEVIVKDPVTQSPTTPSTAGGQTTTNNNATTSSSATNSTTTASGSTVGEGQAAEEVKQIEEFQKKCGTAKIKISVKKKSAKKIKITLKKALQVADGYEIRVYKTRKNARKNKKVFVKAKTKTNKRTFNISNKKLRNKKVLFLRVRGYKKIGKKTIFSKKWSVTKKVKIK